MQNKGQKDMRYNFLHTLFYFRNIPLRLHPHPAIKIDLYQF